MYGGFPGMGFGGGVGAYAAASPFGAYSGAGVGVGWWGIGAVVVGTLILIAICCVFFAGI
ncbi:MAG TPA: hypothetical protein VHQ46_05320 [Desulfobacteria bacterium]|nr:hypothetical protein [Desulfobacteria bacterium]